MSKKTVLISYSHDSDEHRDRVLALSERLRADGLETVLDQYVNGSPAQGWPRWMLDQLDAADSVLVICTETYYRRFRGQEEAGKGRGVDWEGALITQEIYNGRSKTLKFVPVFLSAAKEDWIPEPLRSGTHYALTSEEAYQRLYDFLLEQAHVEPGPIGALKYKAPRRLDPLTFRAETPSSNSIPTTSPTFPSMQGQSTKLLVVSASPKDSPVLNVDVEIRDIKRAVKAARYRDLFPIVEETAMLADEFAHSVHDHAPQILHFSGYHSAAGGIMLMDDESRSKPVSSAALRHVLGKQPGLRMVVLNTCYSLATAKALVENIDFAIGVEDGLDDLDATLFARTLYAALADGNSVQSAFDQAVTHMVGKWPKKNIPQLRTKNGINAAELAFIGVSSPHAGSPPGATPSRPQSPGTAP